MGQIATSARIRGLAFPAAPHAKGRAATITSTIPFELSGPSQGTNNGFSLGNGNGGTLNISPADFDPAKEIRTNCGGAGKINYRVALYK